jgi:hypothetical protein
MKSYLPFVAYAAVRIDEAGREAYLRQCRARVFEIADYGKNAA